MHSHKWREIGTHLGFLLSELDKIQATPFLISNAPHSWLSTMLARWLLWCPGDSRGTTKYPSLEDLKQALSEMGLEYTARNLRI